MNQGVTKLILKFLDRYRANVKDVVHEKQEVIKEAQAKIDALKIEYIKKQINQHDKPGN